MYFEISDPKGIWEMIFDKALKMKSQKNQIDFNSDDDAFNSAAEALIYLGALDGYDFVSGK